MAARRVCEDCGRDVARLEVAGRSLCARCARRAEAKFVGGDSIMVDMLAAIEPTDACPFCGATATEIERDGLAGCWKCYETFGDRLMAHATG